MKSCRYFSEFGAIRDVDVKRKFDSEGNVLNTFAFVSVDVKSSATVAECIRRYNGMKWKGKVIKVQAAQESFMQRLQRERRERMANFSTEQDPSYDPMALMRQRMSAGDEDKGLQKADVKVEEGSVRQGVVVFNEDKRKSSAGEWKGRIRQYHSSSDEEGSTRGPARVEDTNGGDNKQTRPKATKRSERGSSTKEAVQAAVKVRKRYYSSSDDEEDATASRSHQRPRDMLKRLKSFNSGIWSDSNDKKEESGRSPPQVNAKGTLEVAGGPQKLAPEEVNKKRLSSLRQRLKDIKQQKMLLKISLSKTDQADGNAKKRFVDDEDNEEGEAKVGREQLFDDDVVSSADEEEFSLKVQPQFQGKGGEKLLALQSKFASDSRFKIDSRFKDEESEEEVGGEEGEERELEQERKRNLDILESVVGTFTSSSSGKAPKPWFQFRDINEVTYDPSLEESKKRLEVSPTKGNSADQKTEAAQGRQKRAEAPAPNVSAKRSFWMKQDLFSKQEEQQEQEQQKAFSFGFSNENQKSTDGRGFSLLKTFDGEAADEDYQAHDLHKNKKKRLDFLESNPFKYDSSDSESEQESDVAKPAKDAQISNFGRQLAEKSATSSSSSLREPFFISNSKDSRVLSEAAEFLSSRTSERGDAQSLRERFERERPLLRSILKKKLRAKAKKQALADRRVFGGTSRKTGSGWNRKKRKTKLKGQIKMTASASM